MLQPFAKPDNDQSETLVVAFLPQLSICGDNRKLYIPTHGMAPGINIY